MIKEHHREEQHEPLVVTGCRLCCRDLKGCPVVEVVLCSLSIFNWLLVIFRVLQSLKADTFWVLTLVSCV